jgi:NTE family protein
VLLWSAVAASCALPGVMRPVTLMARAIGKGHGGAPTHVPYHAVGTGLQLIDGSMLADVPREEMGLLFHVQRSVVSQANPHLHVSADERARALSPPRA